MGARQATGDVLLFIDADVTVHADVVERVVSRFELEPELDGLIGTYDNAPADPGFVSQFKNLMHAFVHCQGKPDAWTFWCGCGAVRRSVFVEHGGLDESYTRPAIEDIEFGYRLRFAGHAIALDPGIQCKHLKTWTFWSLVYTDVFHRGLPWTKLILRTGMLPDDLNLRWSQRVSAILAALLLPICVLAAWQMSGTPALLPQSTLLAAASAIIGAILAANWKFYAFLAGQRGWFSAICALPLHILYFIYSLASFGLGLASHLLGLAAYAPKRAPVADVKE
jgi:GT2 family glycosyltransferase